VVVRENKVGYNDVIEKVLDYEKGRSKSVVIDVLLWEEAKRLGEEMQREEDEES